MDLMCLRSFIGNIYSSIIHIVISKDMLFYVQENSKGFITKKTTTKNEKKFNKMYSINK